MVFFNDPVALRRRPGARDPDERRDAHPGPRAGRVLGPAGARPRARHRDRPGLRHPGPDRLRRAGTTTPRSGASPTWPRGCAPTPSRGRSSSPSGCSRRPARWSWVRTPARASCAGSAGASTPSTSRASTTRGPCHDRRPLDASGRRGRRALEARRGRAVPPLRRAAGPDGRGLGRDAAQPRRRVGGRRPLDHPRPGRGVERKHHPVLRGAVPVPADAAAPAPAADGLRHLDADRPGDHRVLPRPPARGDPQPCAVPAVSRRRARRVARAP